jgi:hypothetical protein
VPREHGPNVEEGQNLRLVEHEMGGGGPRDDGVEDAGRWVPHGAHGRQSRATMQV